MQDREFSAIQCRPNLSWALVICLIKAVLLRFFLSGESRTVIAVWRHLCFKIFPFRFDYFRPMYVALVNLAGLFWLMESKVLLILIKVMDDHKLTYLYAHHWLANSMKWIIIYSSTDLIFQRRLSQARLFERFSHSMLFRFFDFFSL